MNILVTFAVEAEFAPWRNRRKFRRLPGEWPRFEAQFGGARVRAVLTGMGQTHALEAARRMLPDRPDICISTGLAGAPAVECGARQVERFATSPKLVSRAAEKLQLGKQAEAVEMESYIILAEAARHGVPAVAVRAVSDTLDFDMPYDFERVRNAQGQIRIGGIIAQVLRHPSGLPALLSLARDCRLAARHLADFLDAYAGMLGDRLILIEPGLVAAQ